MHCLPGDGTTTLGREQHSQPAEPAVSTPTHPAQEAEGMEIIKTMYHWPGTPGPDRLAAAELLIEQDARRTDRNQPSPWEQPGVLNQAQQDARILLDYLDIEDFSRWAHEELQRTVDDNEVQSGLDLTRIAFQGSDERFIGMVIDRENPDQPDDPDRQNGCSITRLYRHPDWAGLNPQLPQCQGLEIHVFCHQDNPDDPQVIIATQPNAMPGAGTHLAGTEPQGDLHRAIRDITAWHGALRHTWTVSQDD